MRLKQDDRLTVRINSKLLTKLRASADKLDVSLTSLVIELIEQFIKEQKK